MRQRIKTKTEELGGQLVEVDPAYTSQTCPSCGHVSRENRKTQAQLCLQLRLHRTCRHCRRNEHPRKRIVGGRSARCWTSRPRNRRRAFGRDAERADEASNKSSREPVVSGNGAGGSRGAKPHTRKGLAARTIDPRTKRHGQSRVRAPRSSHDALSTACRPSQSCAGVGLKDLVQGPGSESNGGPTLRGRAD